MPTEHLNDRPSNDFCIACFVRKPPRTPNDGAHVTLQFFPNTMEQLAHIQKAAQHLLSAGISFDTGGNRRCVDWELDWSLTGARIHLQRNKEEAAEYMKEYLARKSVHAVSVDEEAGSD